MACALDPNNDMPRLSDEARAANISALRSSARFMLSRYLDVPGTTVSTSGNVKDFEGLSELMGFDNRDVAQFRMNEKTKSLLEAYGQKHNATIGRLWDLLAELELYEILNDVVLIKAIEKDVIQFQERAEELEIDPVYIPAPTSRPTEPAIPLKMPEVKAIPQGKDKYAVMDMQSDEYHHITVGEVETNKPEMFDAFLSYSDGDIQFVKELIRMLEESHGLKLCVNARDLVIGTALYPVTAKLIAERCRKVLIIMSPKFLDEPECDFQIKFAHALSPGSRSKKMIPILISQCDYPLILKHVTSVDHTKVDSLEWFYGRLVGSLRAAARADETFMWQADDDLEILNETTYEFEHSIPVREEIEEERAQFRRRLEPTEHSDPTALMPGIHNHSSEESLPKIMQGRNNHSSTESLSKPSRETDTISAMSNESGLMLREDLVLPPSREDTNSMNNLPMLDFQEPSTSQRTPVQSTDVWSDFPTIPPLVEPKTDKDKKKEKDKERKKRRKVPGFLKKIK